MKGLYVGRIYKHSEFPELSPMSQRGHDLLDLYVKWAVDKLDEVWDADTLAHKMTDYFALCVQSDLKILIVHTESRMLIEDSLQDVGLTYAQFERLANAIAVAGKDEKTVRLVISASLEGWTINQQDIVTEGLLLQQDSDRRVQSYLVGDWIEMTGNTSDRVDILKRGLDFDLKYMTEAVSVPLEDVRQSLLKKDFFAWRLRQIARLADVYRALDSVVARDRNIAKEYMDWKVKKQDNLKEKEFSHDA